MSNRFVILGIHDEEVSTVKGDVARVRMYVGNKEIDEDFKLPVISRESGVPKNVQTYTYFLTEEVEARMKKLGGSK